jgi:hypothetical protein
MTPQRPPVGCDQPAGSPSELLIGLEARCLRAMSKVLRGIDDDAADGYLADAVLQAEVDGYHLARKVDRETPTLLEEDSALSDAWHRGAACWLFYEEISSCISCRNARGDPCPLHG